MPDRAVISFVIPVRNDRERLRRCIASILPNADSTRSTEIVVVDNGSSDGSERIGASFGARVLRVSGVSVAALRNRGAATASSDVLAFVDADHELSADWVCAALDVMRDEMVGAAGALCLPPPGGTWVQRTYGALRGKTMGRGEVEWLGSGNLAVRRAAFQDVGGFDETLEASEDVDLCRRLVKRGWRLVGDERLFNIHHGDPATLKQLFRSELWRGRNNLRVSLRAGVTLRSLPGVLFPVVQLAGLVLLVAGVVGIRSGWGGPAAVGLALLAITSAARTALIARRGRDFRPRFLLQAFAVGCAYDGARALALIWPAGHHRH